MNNNPKGLQPLCHFYNNDAYVKPEITDKEKELPPMIEILSEEEDKQRIRELPPCSSDEKRRSELPPLIITLPEEPEVASKNALNNSCAVNQPQLRNVNNQKMLAPSNIISYIPYCDKLDIAPFNQIHPENTIGWTELYLEVTQKEIIYNVDEKIFRCWNEFYWKTFSNEEIMADIVFVIKQYYYYSYQTSLENDAVKSGKFQTVKEIFELVKSLKGKKSNEFDTAKHCVCVKNGVYSFDDNRLYPHSAYKYNYITYMIDVEYKPGYPDATFTNFINSIMLDYENASCLQKIYGYPLLGEPNEQVCFILKGDGANGKSTLNTAVQNLVGSLATVINIEYFTGNANTNPNAPSPSTYRLKDKLYAFTAEGKAGATLNDATVKKHIGGGKLVARKPYGDLVEFDSKFVLFFDTNHLPHFSEGGHSMERRIIIIPFPATFKGDSLNKNMNKLLDTYSCKMALLAWLIDGARAYKQYGFMLSERISNATHQYFLEEDTIGMFLQEAVVEDANGKVTMMDLYNAYKLYCDQRLVTAKSKDTFCKHSALKKYPNKRSGKIGRYKEGIRLKTEFDIMKG